MKHMIIAALCASAVLAANALAGKKPLKVYILAGQSNMEGHAKVETFDYIGDDPKTAPLLKEMRGADGKPVVCDDVYVSYRTGGTTGGEGHGKLTSGYGARRDPSKDGGKIGPEFTFGIYMQKHVKEPILIIKTAWGGKSLHTDFRPPSAGPYELPEGTKKVWDKHPNGAHGVPKAADRPAWFDAKKKATGVYYKAMMEHVKKVLGDVKRVYPGYDPKQGYELAGFVWFQGWNDMCDQGTYPHGGKGNRFELYSQFLAHFIRDVRTDLKAPKMPFVIGVMGVDGVSEKPNAFRLAMAKPASMPEFKGTVAAVETAPFWAKELGEIDAKRGKVKQMGWFLRVKHKNHANADGKMTKDEQKKYVNDFQKKLISPEDEAKWKRGASNAGYHYLGCAKTMAQIGKAFADALAAMGK